MFAWGIRYVLKPPLTKYITAAALTVKPMERACRILSNTDHAKRSVVANPSTVTVN